MLFSATKQARNWSRGCFENKKSSWATFVLYFEFRKRLRLVKKLDIYNFCKSTRTDFWLIYPGYLLAIWGFISPSQVIWFAIPLVICLALVHDHGPLDVCIYLLVAGLLLHMVYLCPDNLPKVLPEPLVVPIFGTLSLIRDNWQNCPYFVPNFEYFG